MKYTRTMLGLVGALLVGLAVAAPPAAQESPEATAAAAALRPGAVRVELGDKAAFIESDRVRIEFDLSKGTYSGIDKSAGVTLFREASFRLDPGRRTWREPPYEYRAEDAGAVQDEGGAGRRLRFWVLPGKSYLPARFLDVTVYADRPNVVLGWGVRNDFPYAIRVGRAEVLANGRLFRGQEPTAAQVLRGGAGSEANFVEATWKIEAENGAMLTYRDAAVGHVRRTLVAGGLRYAEFARQVEWQEGTKSWSNQGIHSYPGGEPQMTLAIWDPQGKRIAPGKTWESQDTFYLDFVSQDPFASLERYGEALAAANHAKPNAYDFPTLCGWAVSHGKLGEGRPLNHAAGLVELADDARRSGIGKYTRVAFRLEPDYYCYSKQGDTQQGWWDDEHWARYGSLRPPYGTFASFCRAMEERDGIVFTYFQGSMPSNDFAAAHPDWMLNNDISLLHVPHAHQLPLVRYDYTDPGFRAHTLKMWQRLRRDGVKGIKFDYPETAWAAQGGFEDASFTTVSAYREMYRLCREGLGTDAYLHERILGGATHENVPRTDVCAGLVDLQRVWTDASHFEPEMASRMGLRWYKQGKVFRYYPDSKSLFVPGDSKQPLDVVTRRALLTLIGLLGGRLELATSFGRMSPAMLHDLSRVYPVLPNGRTFRPVDLLTGKSHPEVYAYDVASGWMQVLLVNNDAKNPRTIAAPLAGNSADTGALGLDGTARYRVFDFWNQRDLGTMAGSGHLRAELSPGETLIYSVRKAEFHPQVIGTSRNVMCGMFELHHVAWNEARRTLSFAADVVPGEPLVVTLAVPTDLELGSVVTERVTATHRRNETTVSLQLDAGERGVRAAPITITFRPGPRRPH